MTSVPFLQTRTLRAALEQSARLFSDKPALSHIGDKPLSYSEFFESVDTLSHWLAQQGIGFGDKVALLSENSPNWSIVYFAVTSMGAVVVPILTEFHKDAIAHIIRHSEAKLVFVSERLLPKIEDVAFDPLPLFVNVETFAPIEQGIGRDKLREMKSAGMREFRKWKEKALRFAHQTPPQPTEDDLAVIIYTSGTTGHSKGVMLSHGNIISNAEAVRTIVHLDENDRLLSMLPLPHGYECTLGMVLPLLHGAHIHYLDKPPTARVLLPALAQVRPTALLTVPLIMEKLYKTSILPKLTRNRLLKKLYAIPFFRRQMNRAAGKKLQAAFGGALRVVTIGGAPLAADTERFLHEARFPYTIGYGLTETSPLVSGANPENRKLYSAGPSIPGVNVRVVDESGLSSREGEIQVSGPNVMQGYYKAPEITEEVFTEDGWLRTGDLGTVDQEGYIFIKGRLKNVVLGPSGENIYPEEIESFFFGSPYVFEALVYQHEGKLTARVHLDAEKVDELVGALPEEEAARKTADLLESIRQTVNSKVSTFARVHRVIEQTEPFEKTPTQKIKRYLYVDS